MPLIKSNSPAAVSENIRRLVREKKPQAQAVAIALDIARRASTAKKRALGGPMSSAQTVKSVKMPKLAAIPRAPQMQQIHMPWFARSDIRSISSPTKYGLATGGTAPPKHFADGGFTGFVGSTIPGRTDRHETDLPAGSYVLPADVVSGMGEGNSLAGAARMDAAMGTAPWGVKMPSGHRARSGGLRVQPPRVPSLPSDTGSNPQLSQLLANINRTAGAGMSPSESAGVTDLVDAGAEADSRGGRKRPGIPAVIAGGEVVLHPDQIAYSPKLGALDPKNKDPRAYAAALDRGHAILDKFVIAMRKKTIKTLKKLPGPKR